MKVCDKCGGRPAGTCEVVRDYGREGLAPFVVFRMDLCLDCGQAFQSEVEEKIGKVFKADDE